MINDIKTTRKKRLAMLIKRGDSPGNKIAFPCHFFFLFSIAC
ncbi:hypothetical protein [Xenorhabdus poinarii]|nr:hypothetical protein [Xenorhabdus poinarii]